MPTLVNVVLMAMVWGTAAAAQSVKCQSPQTQLDMNICADLRYQAADDRLNSIWSQVKPQMDAGGLGGLLLDAQRKWLTFRDASCAIERARFDGGSIAPMMFSDCMTRLTEARTESLIEFRY